jgi:hypothetical protein
MNHNTYELEVGQTVTADEGVRGGYTVVISAFTPNQMFATVHPPDHPNDSWEIMTYRLTPLRAIREGEG